MSILEIEHFIHFQFYSYRLGSSISEEEEPKERYVPRVGFTAKSSPKKKRCEK